MVAIMTTHSNERSRGFSLIEVMIAVLVLSIGLLSLAALQGELFRSGAESKARANATAIAQQVIENARTFSFISAPTGYTGDTYMSLADATWTVTAGGVTYNVSRDVVRYQYSAATNKFAEGSAAFSGAVPEF